MKRANIYRKGARYERKIVNSARSEGLISFRSAGSHSPVDVVIIDRDKKRVSFIQCKKSDSYTGDYVKESSEGWTVDFKVMQEMSNLKVKNKGGKNGRKHTN